MPRPAVSMRHAALPPTLPPRLVGRETAAAYIGVSASKFDEMVKDGRMPKPKCIDARRLWDVRGLDSAADQLPTEGELAGNPWDDMP